MSGYQESVPAWLVNARVAVSSERERDEDSGKRGFGRRGLVLVGLMFLVVGCGLGTGSGGSGPGGSGSSLGAGPAGSSGGPPESGSSGGSGEGSAGAGEGESAAELDALYRAWSTPVESGSTFRVSEPKTLPVVVPEGGVTVSAFIPGGKGRGSRTLTRDLPAGATREQVQAVLDEFERIPWAVVDWSPPAVPDSAVPDDPGWGRNELYETDAAGKAILDGNGQKNLAFGQAIPFSRIGLCCAPDGMADGWDLAAATANPGAVQIAVVDSGLFDSGLVTDELKEKFVRGWDASNTFDNSSYNLVRSGWDLYEKSNDPDDKHGSDVAGYAVAQTDNKKGIAGAAGRLNTIKFGMFRNWSYLNGSPGIFGGDVGALGVISRQVADYIRTHNQSGPIQGYKWNIVNGSYGSVAPDKTRSSRLRELAHQGVLVIVSAGNERVKYQPGSGVIYGKNPITFPAADPHAISVAAWGGNPEVVWGSTPMYADMTSVFSSTSPFVDLAAPGEALPEFSVNAKKGYLNGTSYTAPIVAGIAATLISISGDEYQCPDKPTEAARYDCVERLRAALIGATTNIENVDENPSTQGAGVIDAPAAYLGKTLLRVPARPARLKQEVTIHAGDSNKFNLKLFWSSSGTWADGSPREEDEDEEASAAIATYRVYKDGDPTYQVKQDERDPGRLEAQGAGLVAGRWKVPWHWTNYLIPHPPIKKPATGDSTYFVWDNNDLGLTRQSPSP